MPAKLLQVPAAPPGGGVAGQRAEDRAATGGDREQAAADRLSGSPRC
jgi:hypothetical protein